MGMVFPVSTHNYEIRYWLAAAGIHPGMYTEADKAGVTDAEVELSVTPPPMMPTVLKTAASKAATLVNLGTNKPLPVVSAFLLPPTTTSGRTTQKKYSALPLNGPKPTQTPWLLYQGSDPRWPMARRHRRQRQAG